MEFALLLLALLSAAEVARATSEKPNIIMFVIDDLGWNDTSYQGAEYPTPTIDKLANEGIRLKQYYVQRICSPSRSALLSGKYPYNLGLAAGVISNGHPFGLSLECKTIADQLKGGGYGTHAIGKWDLGMHRWEYTPTYRGFDTFYGYYDAAEDYYSHDTGTRYRNPDNPRQYVRAHGIDFRSNKDPLTDKDGLYSTNLFTKAIQDAISSHDEDKKPFFVYGAYQSVHGPLEAPDQYLEQCTFIQDSNRKTFCGMMQALDEGIKNVTDMLESKGLLDTTIIIFSTDNGGQTSEGSSNWPLRGNKGTVFEGGVRGVSFVWGKMLPKLDYDNTRLMHITDWYRTIVEGIAGLSLSDDFTNNLDGYNMWDAITQNSPSPRNEMLIQLNPPYYGTQTQQDSSGQAAYRSGDWKLITGQPTCSTEWNAPTCPGGWVHQNGTIEAPPSNPSQVWLFNITADPYERNDVSSRFPDIVSELKQKIEAHNSTHVQQLRERFDPKSDPSNFGGVWTPWLD